MKYVDYIHFDSNERCPIVRVNCMNCNEQIAARTKRKFDNQLRVKYYSSVKRRRVYLQDNTYADLLLCGKCARKSLDLKKMTKTMRAAWMKESKQKYEISENPAHKKVKKLRFNLEVDEKLPLSYYKQLFKGKTILR